MDTKQIKQKALNENSVISSDDLAKINEHTLVELTAEDVYTFKVQICDNDVDRVGDKMTDEFLEQVAEHITGVTGLKDHDWNVCNQIARLYDAEVVVDDTNLTVLGEPRKYVLGKAYTLSKHKELIDNINAGLLKETSISFNSSGDVCSICGSPMVKDMNDVGHCGNKHIAGHYYEDKLCFNKLNKLDDILEWSLVAVPCQPKAGINNKNIGGNNIMKRAELLIRQFMSSKSYSEAAPEDKAALDEAMDKTDDIELSDEDIRNLVDENGRLKARVKELEDEVKSINEGYERDSIKAIVSKGIDELQPLTTKVKEMMMKDIPWDTLKLEDGQIPGMDDVFAGIKESYKGLYKEVENKSVDNEVENKSDVSTPEVVNKSVNNESDNTEIKYKSTKHSGITFGVNTNSKSNKVSNNVNKPKAGIYFN